jgi:RNA polymerase sigma-70 factor (ECF subfamily)
VNGGTEPEPNDSELVRGFQRGDDHAFGALMARHERRVYNLAYRMLGNSEDARDATQDAFLSCFRHLSTFRGDSAFGTWLHRIAVNACYDALRRRRETLSLDDRPTEPAQRDHADQTASAIDIQRALLAVPPDFRVVVVMHEIQDMPIEDVAAILGLPAGTVKSRLHRGRVALGRALSAGEAATREPEAAQAPSKPPHP